MRKPPTTRLTIQRADIRDTVFEEVEIEGPAGGVIAVFHAMINSGLPEGTYSGEIVDDGAVILTPGGGIPARPLDGGTPGE